MWRASSAVVVSFRCWVVSVWQVRRSCVKMKCKSGALIAAASLDIPVRVLR